MLDALTANFHLHSLSHLRVLPMLSLIEWKPLLGALCEHLHQLLSTYLRLLALFPLEVIAMLLFFLDKEFEIHRRLQT